jgi:hypothetical protein
MTNQDSTEGRLEFALAVAQVFFNLSTSALSFGLPKHSQIAKQTNTAPSTAIKSRATKFSAGTNCRENAPARRIGIKTAVNRVLRKLCDWR